MCTWCFPSSILHACIPSLLGGRNKTVGDLCCCSRWWDDIDWAVGRVVGYDLPLQQVSYHTPPPMYLRDGSLSFIWLVSASTTARHCRSAHNTVAVEHHSLTIGMDLPWIDDSSLSTCVAYDVMTDDSIWSLLNLFPFWSFWLITY